MDDTRVVVNKLSPSPQNAPGNFIVISCVQQIVHPLLVCYACLAANGAARQMLMTDGLV